MWKELKCSMEDRVCATCVNVFIGEYREYSLMKYEASVCVNTSQTHKRLEHSNTMLDSQCPWTSLHWALEV